MQQSYLRPLSGRAAVEVAGAGSVVDDLPTGADASVRVHQILAQTETHTGR